MPKVTIDTEKARAQKRFDYVAGMLSGGIRQQRLSTKDISQKTGIPQRTVTERLEHPEKVRLEDLYKLADIAGIKIIFQMKEDPE